MFGLSAECHVFKAGPRCVTPPFLGVLCFHCVDRPHFAHLLVSWQTSALSTLATGVAAGAHIQFCADVVPHKGSCSTAGSL